MGACVSLEDKHPQVSNCAASIKQIDVQCFKTVQAAISEPPVMACHFLTLYVTVVKSIVA